MCLLRFINIGLFAAALPLYRRLLLKTGASRALVNLCLAIFVLIPVVPLLAAQINYDNLLLPMTAISLLLAVSLGQELRRTRRLNLKTLLWLAIIVTLTCLVKYAFLPILLVIGAYLTVLLCWTYPNIKVSRPSPLKAKKRQQTPIALSPERHIFYNNLSNFRQLEE